MRTADVAYNIIVCIFALLVCDFLIFIFGFDFFFFKVGQPDGQVLSGHIAGKR